MALLVQVIGQGVHPDDWMKNYSYLLSRTEKVAAYAQSLEQRLERLETVAVDLAARLRHTESLVNLR